jgi:hypothetical protein
MNMTEHAVGGTEKEWTMRRFAIAVALIGMLAFPAAASAHPSENRAEQGFGGGPHCHFVLPAGEGSRAYPSHTAHMAQLEHSPVGTVFAATACD